MDQMIGVEQELESNVANYASHYGAPYVAKVKPHKLDTFIDVSIY